MFHKSRHEGAGTLECIKEARVAGAPGVSVGGGGGRVSDQLDLWVMVRPH